MFQQQGELREMAGVKPEPDTEVGNASAAAAVKVCNVQAAILGEGVPAAPAPAGVQMASNQQLLAALLPGLNPRKAMGEDVLDTAALGAPVEVAAAAAGASSGDVAGTAAAAADPALGLAKPARGILATAAAGTNCDRPLEVGLSEGEQGGRIVDNMQMNAAAKCSAGRRTAMALLVGASSQGLTGQAEKAAVGSSCLKAVASNPSDPDAVGISGAAHIEQLRQDQGRSQAAADVHPLAIAAPSAIAPAVATQLPPPATLALAGDVGMSGGDNHVPKQTTSVQEAALEVLDLCTSLNVSTSQGEDGFL